MKTNIGNILCDQTLSIFHMNQNNQYFKSSFLASIPYEASLPIFHCYMALLDAAIEVGVLALPGAVVSTGPAGLLLLVYFTGGLLTDIVTYCLCIGPILFRHGICHRHHRHACVKVFWFG